MRNTATFEEWDTYPENLDLGSGNRARYDCNLYRKQLHDDSHRLFIENQPISLKVIEVGGYGSSKGVSCDVQTNTIVPGTRPAFSRR